MNKDRKKLRIIFMGTPDFAVASLEAIHLMYGVVAVITSTDKKAGRGQKLRQSAVKQYAVKNDIPVLQPVNLKSPEFIDQLKSFDANLFVVVAFRMLPEIVWAMPELGTINLHGSLLPHYRGAAPINRAIMNGETETGVTTFFIEKEIDTGKVILQKEMTIGPDETAGELHDRMMVLGAKALVETLDIIEENNVEAKSQKSLFSSESELKKAPKIFKEDCEINWKEDIDVVHNFIRGLSPYPTAWTQINDKSFKIFRGKKTKLTAVRAGKVETDSREYIRIHTGDFQYEITELQMAGKKRMKTSDFLRGNSDEIIPE